MVELTAKQKKRKWHLDNKPFVFEYFNKTCQECKKPINGKWDIHHLTYHYKHGKLYESPAMELIENEIITLVCRPCHNIIHTADDPSNKQHNENKAPCEICGRIERGIFDRKKGENLDKLLCRRCWINYKGGVTQTTLF